MGVSLIILYVIIGILFLLLTPPSVIDDEDDLLGIALVWPVVTLATLVAVLYKYLMLLRKRVYGQTYKSKRHDWIR